MTFERTIYKYLSTLKIDNINIEQVKKYNYLIINTHLNWKTHTTKYQLSKTILNKLKYMQPLYSKHYYIIH